MEHPDWHSHGYWREGADAIHAHGHKPSARLRHASRYAKQCADCWNGIPGFIKVFADALALRGINSNAHGDKPAYLPLENAFELLKIKFLSKFSNAFDFESILEACYNRKDNPQSLSSTRYTVYYTMRKVYAESLPM